MERPVRTGFGICVSLPTSNNAVRRSGKPLKTLSIIAQQVRTVSD